MMLVALAVIQTALAQTPSSYQPSFQTGPRTTSSPSGTGAAGTMSADPTPSSSSESFDEENPFAKRGYHLRAIIAGSLSGAFLLTSGTLYLLAANEHHKLNTAGAFAFRSDVLASAQHGQRLQFASAITGGIGLIFGVGAGAMYLIDHNRAAEAEKNKHARAPVLVPTGNGVALVGTFQ